jgi:hypothetical protein
LARRSDPPDGAFFAMVSARCVAASQSTTLRAEVPQWDWPHRDWPHRDWPHRD